MTKVNTGKIFNILYSETGNELSLHFAFFYDKQTYPKRREVYFYRSGAYIQATQPVQLDEYGALPNDLLFDVDLNDHDDRYIMEITRVNDPNSIILLRVENLPTTSISQYKTQSTAPILPDPTTAQIGDHVVVGANNNYILAPEVQSEADQAFLSNMVLDGCVVSKLDDTHFKMTAGNVIFFENNKEKKVSFNEITTQAITNIATQEYSYIYLHIDGSISQSQTYQKDAIKGANILIARIDHIDRKTITHIQYLALNGHAIPNQILGLYEDIKYKAEGIKLEKVTQQAELITTEGWIRGYGVNPTDILNANKKYVAQQDNISIGFLDANGVITKTKIFDNTTLKLRNGNAITADKYAYFAVYMLASNNEIIALDPDTEFNEKQELGSWFEQQSIPDLLDNFAILIAVIEYKGGTDLTSQDFVIIDAELLLNTNNKGQIAKPKPWNELINLPIGKAQDHKLIQYNTAGNALQAGPIFNISHQRVGYPLVMNSNGEVIPVDAQAFNDMVNNATKGQSHILNPTLSNNDADEFWEDWLEDMTRGYNDTPIDDSLADGITGTKIGYVHLQMNDFIDHVQDLRNTKDVDFTLAPKTLYYLSGYVINYFFAPPVKTTQMTLDSATKHRNNHTSNPIVITSSIQNTRIINTGGGGQNTEDIQSLLMIAPTVTPGLTVECEIEVEVTFHGNKNQGTEIIFNMTSDTPVHSNDYKQTITPTSHNRKVTITKRTTYTGDAQSYYYTSHTYSDKRKVMGIELSHNFFQSGLNSAIYVDVKATYRLKTTLRKNIATTVLPTDHVKYLYGGTISQYNSTSTTNSPKQGRKKTDIAVGKEVIFFLHFKKKGTTQIRGVQTPLGDRGVKPPIIKLQNADGSTEVQPVLYARKPLYMIYKHTITQADMNYKINVRIFKPLDAYTGVASFDANAILNAYEVKIGIVREEDIIL